MSKRNAKKGVGLYTVYKMYGLNTIEHNNHKLEWSITHQHKAFCLRPKVTGCQFSVVGCSININGSP